MPVVTVVVVVVTVVAVVIGDVDTRPMRTRRLRCPAINDDDDAGRTDHMTPHVWCRVYKL